MWFFSALLAGSLFTVSGLMTRHILKGNKDAWAFSFYYSAIGAIVSLPFALGSFQAASSFGPWAIMVVVGFLIMLQNYLNFKSSNSLPASVNGIVNKFRLVWVFVLGLILTFEAFNLNKLFGMLFTIIAGIVLLSKKSQAIDKYGVLYAFSATFLYAVVIMLYQVLFKSFNSQTLTLFIFVFPALINLALMPNRFMRIANIFKTYGKSVIFTCVCGGFGNLAMTYSLNQGNSTSTLVTMEVFLILTLVLEGLVLKEKGGWARKTLAVVLAVIGAVIIRLS
jgi:drug/metabolite transporter (DMT)-like permease